MTDRTEQLLEQIQINTAKLVDLFGKSAGGKDAKGPVMTVTGLVATLGDEKTAKNNKQYRSFKLDNGFVANAWSDRGMDIVFRAYGERLPVVIEFIESGKFKNIESIRLGATPNKAKPVIDDDDDSAVPF